MAPRFFTARCSYSIKASTNPFQGGRKRSGEHNAMAPASLIGGALAPIRFTSKHAHEYSQEASVVHIVKNDFRLLPARAGNRLFDPASPKISHALKKRANTRVGFKIPERSKQ